MTISIEEATTHFSDLIARCSASGAEPTEPEAVEAAAIMHEVAKEHGFPACLTLWAAIQKNTPVLFAIHEYVEKLMVTGASGQTLPDDWDGSVEGIRNRAHVRRQERQERMEQKAADALANLAEDGDGV